MTGKIFFFNSRPSLKIVKKLLVFGAENYIFQFQSGILRNPWKFILIFQRNNFFVLHRSASIQNEVVTLRPLIALALISKKLHCRVRTSGRSRAPFQKELKFFQNFPFLGVAPKIFQLYDFLYSHIQKLGEKLNFFIWKRRFPLLLGSLVLCYVNVFFDESIASFFPCFIDIEMNFNFQTHTVKLKMLTRKNHFKMQLEMDKTFM